MWSASSRARRLTALALLSGDGAKGKPSGVAAKLTVDTKPESRLELDPRDKVAEPGVHSSRGRGVTPSKDALVPGAHGPNKIRGILKARSDWVESPPATTGLGA